MADRPPTPRVVTRVPDLGDDGTASLGGDGTASLAEQSDVPERGTISMGAASKEDRYRVREEIGRGGMGRILRVEDTDLQREIAMKVLLPGGSGQGMRRFIEEAQITSQLEHPGLLPVHDFGVSSKGEIFFTMQFIRSHETIADIVGRLREGDTDCFKEYTFERRVQVMQQVCHALHYAHERGVIHRDIKPSNLVVGAHGEVYLVDWGVAKLIDAQEGDRPQTLRDDPEKGRTETRAGTVLGTPAYMAPEQVLGLNDQIGPHTDAYALAAVLYEFLTLNYYLGDVSDSFRDLVAAITNRKPPDAESHWDPLNKRVPRQLSRICRKGLSKKIEGRYQGAQEIGHALQLWLEGNGPVVCPGTAIQRGLARYSRMIDNRPVLLPAVSITAAVLLFGWLIVASVLALLA